LPEPLRLRGSVLDLYEGKGVWVSSSRFETKQVKLKADSFTSFVARDQSALFTMHVSLQRPSKMVYSLYQPVGIETDEATLLFYDMPLHTMRFSATSTFPKRYSVKIDLQRYITSDSAMMQTGRYENDAVTELATGLLEEEKINTVLLKGANEEVRTKVSQIFVDYLTSNAFQFTS